MPDRINLYSQFYSIDRGSSVRTHLDCQWITTQILHKHSLYVPANTDLIVGYMFQVSTKTMVSFLIQIFFMISGLSRYKFNFVKLKDYIHLDILYDDFYHLKLHVIMYTKRDDKGWFSHHERK